MEQWASKGQYRPYYVYFVGLVAALAGLLFGIDTGVISGANPLIVEHFSLSTKLEGLVVSILLIGAVVGTVISNIVSRVLGRKIAIVISTVLFAFCAFFSSIAPDVVTLIIVRFFLGIALGVAAFTTPIYLAEVAPRKIRGAMISLYQLMITIGLLVAFVSDTIIADSWRWMLGVATFPALLMLVLMVRLPRSPRWLMLKMRVTKAKNVLSRILPCHEDVEEEVRAIEESLQKDDSLLKLLKDKKFLVVALLGIGLQLFQQWTGINVVMYYAPTVFKEAGFVSQVNQMWCMVAVGGVNVLTTILAVWYVDRLGRRPILFIGLVLMTIGLLTTGYAMHLSDIGHSIPALGVVGVLVFIFGFAISMGPIVWILCAEIFPLRGRDFGVMLTTASNWLFNFILAQFFPVMVASYGGEAMFNGFASLSVICILFVYFFVPETKGVSLEEIEHNLMDGQPLRLIGRH